VQIVIALFDRFTALDAVGPYQVLCRVPGAKVVFAADHAGAVSDDARMMSLQAQASFAEVPSPDIVVIPGGPGQTDQMTPGPLQDWLIAADKTSAWTASVCTGSLILAGAGLLAGRQATTNWLAHDELRRLGAVARQERYVFDGKYVTAAGVSAGIDMALALVGRIASDEEAQRIQLAIEYDPQPPYDSGSPATAKPEIAASLRAASRFAHSV
jgi:transcriptional regulator GlxA family with amidase domain